MIDLKRENGLKYARILRVLSGFKCFFGRFLSDFFRVAACKNGHAVPLREIACLRHSFWKGRGNMPVRNHSETGIFRASLKGCAKIRARHGKKPLTAWKPISKMPC